MCGFAVAVRQRDAELPTSFGKEAEPRIILRTRDESKDAVAVEPKDSEQDTSTVSKEPEDLGIDPAAYDAMTPTQKKLFDLRLKLVSWILDLESPSPLSLHGKGYVEIDCCVMHYDVCAPYCLFEFKVVDASP